MVSLQDFSCWIIWRLHFQDSDDSLSAPSNLSDDWLRHRAGSRLEMNPALRLDCTHSSFSFIVSNFRALSFSCLHCLSNHFNERDVHVQQKKRVASNLFGASRELSLWGSPTWAPHSPIPMSHCCTTVRCSNTARVQKRPVCESWIASVVRLMSQIMCRKEDWMVFILIHFDALICEMCVRGETLRHKP